MKALEKKIRAGAQNAKLAWGTFVAYVFVSNVSFQWALHDVRHSTLPTAVVNDKTYYVGHSVPIMEARDIHVELAKMAAITMYGRNPNGLDDVETLKRIFADNPKFPCVQMIQEGVAKDAQVFRDQNITQSFKPTRDIVEVARSQDSCTMLVEGDVVSVATINGQDVPDSKAIRLIFDLERNARWGDNGKFPMVVTRFKATYLTDKERQSGTVVESK